MNGSAAATPPTLDDSKKRYDEDGATTGEDEEGEQADEDINESEAKGTKDLEKKRGDDGRAAVEEREASALTKRARSTDNAEREPKIELEDVDDEKETLAGPPSVAEAFSDFGESDEEILTKEGGADMDEQMGKDNRADSRTSSQRSKPNKGDVLDGISDDLDEASQGEDDEDEKKAKGALVVRFTNF
jgi:hypothetical protein